MSFSQYYSLAPDRPSSSTNQQQAHGEPPPFSRYTHVPPAFDPPSPPPASQQPQHLPSSHQFDIFDWSPKYVSCQGYFLDHAQHSGPVQVMASFINILLPYQRNPPTTSSVSLPPRMSMSPQAPKHGLPANAPSPFPGPMPSTSLTPYLRRLVVTGLDFPGVLHGFFGDDWVAGIGPLHEQERRNYLFAAKSGGWAAVKKDYDMGPLETVPFLRPLQGTLTEEIEAAERGWSEWLAMEDWMVGPRAPREMDDAGPADVRIKQEVR